MAHHQCKRMVSRFVTTRSTKYSARNAPRKNLAPKENIFNCGEPAAKCEGEVEGVANQRWADVYVANNGVSLTDRVCVPTCGENIQLVKIVSRIQRLECDTMPHVPSAQSMTARRRALCRLPFASLHRQSAQACPRMSISFVVPAYKNH